MNRLVTRGLLLAMVAAACSDDTATTQPPAIAERITFASNRDGNLEVYAMGADGSNVTRLTTEAAFDREPVWSPAGDRIAFESERDGNFEIYLTDADGSNATNLTDHPATDALPAWSPDGTRIAFESNRDGNREIYVIGADGSNVTRLTNNRADDSLPSWSPTPQMWTTGPVTRLGRELMAQSGSRPCVTVTVGDWAARLPSVTEGTSASTSNT